MLDAILPLRSGANEELRYAVRSWQANLPHRSLVVAGGKPEWLTDVQHLPVPQDGLKCVNALANLRALLYAPGLTDDVIVLMDDLFVLEPIESVPALHRGPMREVLEHYSDRNPGSPYTKAMASTRLLLLDWGIADPLSFALHVPIVVNRARLRAVLDQIATSGAGWDHRRVASIQWRTVYGNLHCRESATYSADVKIYDREFRREWPTPFISTSDASFQIGPVGEFIRSRFPDPCEYESR